MLYLTMNQIRAHNPCTSGWENLLKKAKEAGLSYPEDGDIPISMNTLLDWCPVEDVTWAFRCNWTEGKEVYVKFTQSCAERAKTYADAAADAAYAAYADAAADADADVAAAYAYTAAADVAAADAAYDAYANTAAAAACADVAAANTAYAAATAADAADADAASYAVARERRLQKAILRALLRNHKG